MVLIDMQRIFQEPESQWFVSNYPSVEAKVSELHGSFDQVIWTRFVRDPQEPGAWADYYDRSDRCRADPESTQWDITIPLDPHERIIILPTLSKWGAQMAELTKGYAHLVVAGVATDCCVLSTVLGAVDAGKRVSVVADACGGATAIAHAQALDLMRLLSPMVTITTVASLLG